MGRSAALLAAAATVVFVGVGQGAGPEAVWAMGAGALAAGLLAPVRRVSLVLPASLGGALLQGALFAVAPPGAPLGADWPLVQSLGLAAAGPFAAGLMVVIFAWPLLRLSGTASAFRLRRVTRLRHPLLTELRKRAPGTFRHSANVSRLAQAGGRALGADVTLLGAAGLYHDVGKLAAPGLFAENMADQKDPHDSLAPEESALRLRRHVRDGLELARRFRLPPELSFGIAEHHGTALVRAPAARARAAGQPLDPAIYHYPGPLPRSRESAILMVADAVEGASRRLYDPSLAEVSALVEEVVDRLMTEYQFEDCDLGQVELVALQEALVHALRHSLHRRRVAPAALEEKP
jgi:putative nucleotidyltransferase with HDIG domain